MFEVSVSRRFVAAHQLRLADETMEPLHEHDWRVVVTFAGPELDQTGVLVDFANVQARLDELLGSLQCSTLNHLPALRARNPSAEQVAMCVAEQIGRHLSDGVRLRCVEVEEEPGCVARYFPTHSQPLR